MNTTVKVIISQFVDLLADEYKNEVVNEATEKAQKIANAIDQNVSVEIYNGSTLVEIKPQ